ncbi:MAG: hypothetical protein KDA71_14895 [Planctomycetales bacterium]|nr:hypothetical protein [Planctomycetales bacterium]
MKRLADFQRGNNQKTEHAWDEFASHRQRVMDILLRSPAAASENPALALLGYGNGNDVKLSRLVERFSTVHLVDLDAEAVQASLTRSGLVNHPRLAVNAPVDLSGILSELERWRASHPLNSTSSPPSPVDGTTVEEMPWLNLAAQSPLPFTHSCEVTASLCVLTQMIDSVVATFGDPSPYLLPTVQAVRLRHLEMLLELTSPSGTAVFVTDVVSSSTAPELTTWDETALPDLLMQLVRARNFFTGANPFAILNQLKTTVTLASRIQSIHLVAPWRWQMGSRVYLVTAIVIRRNDLA